MKTLLADDIKLTEEIGTISGPVSKMLGRAWTKLLRLTSHSCTEKAFKPAFVPDERHMSKKVFETWRNLGAFKYEPAPPVPEGIIRQSISVRVEETTNDKYEGEIDEATNEADGRGCRIYSKDGTYYEGYWRAG